MKISTLAFFQIFVFAYCFSQKQLPEFWIDSSRFANGDFFGALENYIQNKIGILDTTETSNGIEGQAYHATTKYRLKGGHSYAVYSEWESGSSVIEFKRVRKEEVINLLVAILKHVNLFNPEMEASLRKTGLQYIDLDVECCYFKVEEINKSTFLRIYM